MEEAWPTLGAIQSVTQPMHSVRGSNALPGRLTRNFARCHRKSGKCTRKQSAPCSPSFLLAFSPSSLLPSSLNLRTPQSSLPSQESLSLSLSALTKCVRLNLLLQPTARRGAAVAVLSANICPTPSLPPFPLVQPLHRHDHGHVSEACCLIL